MWHRRRLKLLALLSPPHLFHELARDPVYAGLLHSWIDSLRIPTSARVLEVGCATGALAMALAERGYRVTGLDRSSRMIRAAERIQGASPVRFICGELTDARLEAGGYDVLLGASILNLIADPRRWLQQLPRLLVAGGKASFLFPSPQFSAMGVRAYARAHELNPASQARLQVWQQAAPRLAAHEAVQWLATAGFSEVIVHEYWDAMLVSVSAQRAE